MIAYIARRLLILPIILFGVSMLISRAVNRGTVGGKRVRYIVHDNELMYINHEGLRPHLPALKANPDGTGAVTHDGRVRILYVDRGHYEGQQRRSNDV